MVTYAQDPCLALGLIFALFALAACLVCISRLVPWHVGFRKGVRVLVRGPLDGDRVVIHNRPFAKHRFFEGVLADAGSQGDWWQGFITRGCVRSLLEVINSGVKVKGSRKILRSDGAGNRMGLRVDRF